MCVFHFRIPSRLEAVNFFFFENTKKKKIKRLYPEGNIKNEKHTKLANGLVIIKFSSTASVSLAQFWKKVHVSNRSKMLITKTQNFHTIHQKTTSQSSVVRLNTKFQSIFETRQIINVLLSAVPDSYKFQISLRSHFKMPANDKFNLNRLLTSIQSKHAKRLLDDCYEIRRVAVLH